MKFPEFNTAQNHTLHIPSLNGGIDTRNNTQENNIFTLNECKNIWEENGIIKTRLGLDTAPNLIIKSEEYQRGDFFTYKAESLKVEVEGDLKMLVSETIDYDTSSQFCVTRLLNSNGTVYKKAVLSFFRTTSEIFYIPEKIHFFKGKPKNGSGIFALAGLVNCENYSETIGQLYELSEDFSNWTLSYSPYIPTVLINGRGNRYEFAKSTNQAFTGTPTRVEGLNILNDSFYAYYSTDGYSSAFTLPFSGLTNGEVTGRLYYSAGSYVDWYIGSYQTSATATLYGTVVTMNINRAKGVIYFTVPAGEYAVPLIYNQNENNLRITATKNCGYSIKDIAFSNSVVTADQNIFFGNKNAVFHANCNNPLYFPADSMTFVGNAQSTVTSFAVLNDSIFAFKENEVFSLYTKLGKQIKNATVFTNSDTVFYTPDTVTSKCISNNVGCRKKGCVIEGQNSIYWIGNDFKIYEINSAEKVICKQEKLNMENILNLNKYSSIYGVNRNDKYLFLCENKAVLLDTNDTKNTKWYYWEFPKEIRFLGVANINNIPLFLCYNSEKRLCFSGYLNQNCDRYLTDDVEGATVCDSPIFSLLHTQKINLGCDNEFKKINSITFNLKGSAKIILNNRFAANAENRAATPFKVVTGLCGINMLDILITSKSNISLGSVDIDYTKLNL